MNKAGACPFWAYLEEQVATFCTSPGEKPFPVRSMNLARRGLLALSLLSKRGDTIRPCFLLAKDLFMQVLDAPKLLLPESLPRTTEGFLRAQDGPELASLWEGRGKEMQRESQ